MKWNAEKISELREALKECCIILHAKEIQKATTREYFKEFLKESLNDFADKLIKIATLPAEKLQDFLEENMEIIFTACNMDIQVIVDFLVSPYVKLELLPDEILDRLIKYAIDNKLYSHLEKLCQVEYDCQIVKKGYIDSLTLQTLKKLVDYGKIEIGVEFAELFYTLAHDWKLDILYYLVEKYPQYIPNLNLETTFGCFDNNAWNQTYTVKDYLLLEKVMKVISAYKSDDSINMLEAGLNRRFIYEWTSQKSLQLRKALKDCCAVSGIENKSKINFNTAPLSSIWEYLMDDMENLDPLLLNCFELDKQIVFFFIFYFPETQDKKISEDVFQFSINFLFKHTNKKGQFTILRKDIINHMIDRTREKMPHCLQFLLYKCIANGAFKLFNYLLKKHSNCQYPFIFEPLADYTLLDYDDDEEPDVRATLPKGDFTQILKMIRNLADKVK